MEPTVPFRHALRGGRRPQILLLGNGLERACGGDDWKKLLNRVDVRYTDGNGNVLKQYEAERKRLEDALPFPLLYELLATLPHSPAQLTPEELDAEEQRLVAMMKELLAAPIDIDWKYQLFKELPNLGMDHIFTTNYSYIPEKAFWPRGSFAQPRNRSRFRFHFGTETNQVGKRKRELHYRLHTGYRFRTADRPVGIWHIHGECSVPGGVVVGHDRYGRLLTRIVNCCGEIDFEERVKDKPHYDFRSWPELFLFGDIYVLGFGFADCEFDLWWLLRRKQREKYGDGWVYYYDHDPANARDAHQLLLEAHGVKMLRNPFSDGRKESFKDFYAEALKDIRKRIICRREAEESSNAPILYESI